jgi:ribosomal protein S18 acetylase RimI-like enzyme
VLAAVVEIDTNNNYILIRSLVVHPDFFRQGIAGKLLTFVFETFQSNLFVVETGLENGPATELYEKFGFVEVHQWDTNHGIRKIKFEKRTKNESSI